MTARVVRPRSGRTRFTPLFALALVTALWLQPTVTPVAAQDPDDRGPADGMARLANTTVDLLPGKIGVFEALGSVVASSNLRLVRSPDVADEFDGVTPTAWLWLRDAPAIDALNLLSRMIRVEWTCLGDTVVLHNPDEAGAAGRYRVVIYDVADLATAASDHVAPRLGPGSMAERSSPLWCDDGDQFVDCLDADVLQDIIMESIAPDEWGDLSTIQIVERRLLVRAPESVQARVAEFLDEMRNALAEATVTATGWQITTSAWQKLFNDRAPGAWLDQEMVDRLHALPDDQARRIWQQNVTARNWQRLYAGEVDSTEWTHQVDAEGRATSTVARTGRVLEVRPQISGDRDRVVVNFRQRASRMLELETGDDGLQLPAMSWESYGAEITIPEGSTAVVGGGLVLGNRLPARIEDAPALTLMSVRRSRQAAEPDTRGTRAIQNALERMSLLTGVLVSLNYDDAPVWQVVRDVVSGSGLGIVVTPDLLEFDKTVTLNVANIDAWTALKLVAEAVAGSVTVTPQGVVVMASEDECPPSSIMVSFDVNDMLGGAAFYTAVGALGFYGVPGLESDDGFEPNDRDEPAEILIDDMPDLIMQAVAPETWDGDSWTVNVGLNGHLIATHYDASVLAEVRQMLDALREHRHRLVTVEYELWRVDDPTLADKLVAGQPMEAGVRQQMLAADGKTRRQHAGLLSLTAGQRTLQVIGGFRAWRTSGNSDTPSEQAQVALDGLLVDTRAAYVSQSHVVLDLAMALNAPPAAGQSEAGQQTCCLRASMRMPVNQWQVVGRLAVPATDAARHDEALLVIRTSVAATEGR